MILPLLHPMRMLIVAPSSGGKSSLVAEIVKRKNTSIYPPPQQIVYFAKTKKSVPESIVNEVEFCMGCPTNDDFENASNLPKLIIIDDMQNQSFSSNDVIEGFQRSRHNNVSIIILSQNLFPRALRSRDISLNCSYIILLFNPRDSSSVIPLSRQIDPRNPSFMSKVFFTHVDSAFKYLVVDLNNVCHSSLRFRSSLFDPKVEVFMSEDQYQQLKKSTNNGEISTQLPFALHLPEAE